MKLLLICRSFPPINIMGAVRPYETAKYFDSLGWDVTVICSYEDSYVNTDYEVDFGNIQIIRASKNNYIAALNNNYTSKALEISKRIIRKTIYPEYFILMVKNYESLIDKYILEQGIPDFIISTAKPISAHIVAARIKDKYPSIKWVADFRDLFALRQDEKLNLVGFLKKRSEAKITKNADMITVVTDTMKFKMSKYLDSNIYVIRNGADRVSTAQYKKSFNNKNYIISFTGILYGGFIDIEPILEALKISSIKAEVNFYGSEKSIVIGLSIKYPEVKISHFERVSKNKVKEIQEQSDFLLVGLGRSKSQKGVLTGKFFEYIETAKPIIAICDEDSELAGLVYKYSLGVATRDVLKIRSFMENYILNNIDIYDCTPTELTRKNQLDKLKSLMLTL